MTIAEMAKQYGVTQQAVYQKLKRKGIKRADIQQPGTSELTRDGEELIASLFKRDSVSVTQQALKKSEELFNATQRLQTIENSLKQKTEEAENLKQTVSKLEQDVAALQEKLTAATEERDFLRLTLSQTIETHRIAMAALQPSSQEKGLLARIRARFTKKEE